jgi:Domain of unknown function (DUF4169)
MPANILSLSKARKAKVRAADDTQAQQNRILFGRSKAVKLKDAAEKTLAERRIEAHRIARPPKETPDA